MPYAVNLPVLTGDSERVIVLDSWPPQAELAAALEAQPSALGGVASSDGCGENRADGIRDVS
jgi:hypothetical protein